MVQELSSLSLIKPIELIFSFIYQDGERARFYERKVQKEARPEARASAPDFQRRGIPRGETNKSFLHFNWFSFFYYLCLSFGLFFSLFYLAGIVDLGH
jgi:hypothetical protein